MNANAHTQEKFEGKVIELDVHGAKGLEEYFGFASTTEQFLTGPETVRMLIQMHDFNAFEAGMLWETAKWDARRIDHIERIAVVGEETWREFARGFSRSFSNAEVQYFALQQLESARAWLYEPAPPRT